MLASAPAFAQSAPSALPADARDAQPVEPSGGPSAPASDATPPPLAPPPAPLGSPTEPTLPPPTPAPATSALAVQSVPARIGPETARRLSRRARAARPTWEPPGPRLGAQRQWSIEASWIHVVSSHTARSPAESFFAGGSVAADAFVWTNVSLGVELRASSERGTRVELDGTARTTASEVGALPRIGLLVPLGRDLSFFPKLGAGVAWAQQTRRRVSDRAIPEPERDDHGVSAVVSLKLPLVFQPAPHFFLGAGPTVTRTFGAGGDGDVLPASTDVGADFVFGGAIGGATGRVEAAPAGDAFDLPAGETRRPRFGDHGTLVLGARTSASGHAFFRDDGGSAHAVALDPSLDYFLTNHFSLGVLIAVEHRGRSLDRAGLPDRHRAFELGGGFRAGLEVPLGERLSFYPRIAFGGSYVNRHGQVGIEGYDVTSKALWGDAELPILLHVASHVFVGVGPSVRHDFSRQFDPEAPGPDQLATDVRGSLQLGGWL